MKNFLIGTVFGIVLSQVGFGGIAKMLDNGVNKVKEVSQEQVK
jgi:hypothetical protein